jgi:antitoxin CptB
MTAEPMDAERGARIGKLKWHCRRALLELDLVFARFWAREEANFDVHSEHVLTRLLELEDHDLWALVSNKATTADAELAEMVRRLQSI